MGGRGGVVSLNVFVHNSSRLLHRPVAFQRQLHTQRNKKKRRADNTYTPQCVAIHSTSMMEEGDAPPPPTVYMNRCKGILQDCIAWLTQCCKRRLEYRQTNMYANISTASIRRGQIEEKRIMKTWSVANDAQQYRVSLLQHQQQ